MGAPGLLYLVLDTRKLTSFYRSLGEQLVSKIGVKEKRILGCIKGLLISTTHTGDMLPWEVGNSLAQDFRLDSGQRWIGIRWQEPALIAKADLVCRLVSYLPTLNSLVFMSQIAGPPRHNLCEPSYPLTHTHTAEVCLCFVHLL